MQTCIRIWPRDCQAHRERQYVGHDGRALPILHVPQLRWWADDLQMQANQQYSYFQSVVH